MKLQSRTGERPLWSQLYDILLSRLDSGMYPIGSIIPTEKDFMDEFEISRIVVRQAMDKLLMEERIQRIRGKGTIVLEPKEKLSTSFVSSLHGISESKNYKNRKVKSFTKEMAPQEVYDFWQIPNQSLWCLIRCTYLKDKVVNRFISYYHPNVPISDEDNYQESIYELLAQKGYEITQVTDTITAGLITKEDQEYFQKDLCAVVYRTRTSYHLEEAVEYTYSTYLADGYQLTIENQ